MKINPIPTHFHVHSRLFMLISKMTYEIKNDDDLGKEVRRLIKEYSEGKYNTTSGVDLDKL